MKSCDSCRTGDGGNKTAGRLQKREDKADKADKADRAEFMPMIDPFW